MKVLQIISSNGMYGAEAVVINLARGLEDAGHESLIGVFSHPEEPAPQLFEVARASGLSACLIPCEGQLDLEVPKRIEALLAEEKVDLLHAHGYKADVYVRLASRHVQAPVVATCHTWHDVGFKDCAYGVIDRFALRGFDEIIAVSADVERRLLKAGIKQHRIHRIRNGIDATVFGNSDRKEYVEDVPLVVGMACRLAHEKGIDLFAEMAANILREQPDVRFRIAGDGDQRVAFEQRLTGLNISSHVEVFGRLDDMSAFYSSLDILVSSSRSEGYPINLLEAMANGLPIVATAVGEVPSIVRDHKTGLLVSPGDVQALTDATVSLLQNAEQRRCYGSAAKALAVQEHSASRMTSEIVEIYRHALQARERNSGRS